MIISSVFGCKGSFSGLCAGAGLDAVGVMFLLIARISLFSSRFNAKRVAYDTIHS